VIRDELRIFNSLYNEAYPRFVRFAFGYIKDMALAEDIVSEAFTTYWINKDTLLTNGNARAYILTVVKNKCLNHLQHLQVKLRAEQEILEHEEWRITVHINSLDACNPDFIFSDEISSLIDSTLDSMPAKTKEIFTLNRYEGLSYTEIAQRLEMNSKSIEYHMSKALQLLRISLKEYLPFIILFHFH
jgi:RNA polymerase sigma-70 factor (ECF subfamily)